MGNQNSGPRPRPTALKVLRGNPGHRRLNTREPIPPAGETGILAGLSAGAVTVWEELAPICLAMGTLTTADRRAFGTLCELQATFTKAVRLKDLAPEQFKAREEREIAGTLRPYYEYFGLTPASRARIAVTKPAEAPASKWAGALP